MIGRKLNNRYLIEKLVGEGATATVYSAVDVRLTDPKDPHRQMAWLPCPHRYARPTRQALVRMPKHAGQWAYALLVCSAPDDLLAELGHYPIRPTPTETEQLLALVYAYDRRGGGIETQFKADKRGLAMARRHKRAFPAQEILLLLALLAHNVLVWLRQRLALTQPPLAHLGILRLVRDLFSMAGKANLDAQGYLIHVILNRRAPLAHALVQAFPAACPDTGLSFSLGEI